MLSIYRAAPLMTLLFAAQAFAAGEYRSAGGTIHFTGQIVESLCETATDLQRQQLEMRCDRREGTSVEKWSLASLTGAGASSSLASVAVRYLDPQHKLAILTVLYN